MEQIIKGNHRKYRKNEPVNISPSKLNLFLKCPLQYYFRYLYNWKKKPIQTNWPGSGFGDATHKTLEWSLNELKNGKPTTQINRELVMLKVWTMFYDKWLKEKKEDGSLKISKNYNYEKFTSKGEKYCKYMIQLMFKECKNFKILKTEEKFSSDFKFLKRVEINGIIDLALFFTDKYKLFDFKTTKEGEKFFFVDWERDIQSLIYQYYYYILLEEMPHSFCYLVLDHEKKVIFSKEIYLSKIKKTKKHFKYLIDSLKFIRDFSLNPDLSMANPSENNCRWCDYKFWCDSEYMTHAQKIVRKVKNKK